METIEPLKTEFVLEARVELAPLVVVGPSKSGLRRLYPITGGTFAGPRIRGEVVPGGADWQWIRPDGVTTIEALYTIKTDDDAVIVVRNRGIVVLTPEDLARAARGDRPSTAQWTYLRTTPEFEAPAGPHEWLNQNIFTGSLVTTEMHRNLVLVRVFRVI